MLKGKGILVFSFRRPSSTTTSSAAERPAVTNSYETWSSPPSQLRAACSAHPWPLTHLRARGADGRQGKGEACDPTFSEGHRGQICTHNTPLALCWEEALLRFPRRNRVNLPVPLSEGAQESPVQTPSGYTCTSKGVFRRDPRSATGCFHDGRTQGPGEHRAGVLGFGATVTAVSTGCSWTWRGPAKVLAHPRGRWREPTEDSSEAARQPCLWLL